MLWLIDWAWKKIPAEPSNPAISLNGLDGTEDGAVWDKEGEEAEDPEEAIDNEFEMESKGDGEWLVAEQSWLIQRFFSEPQIWKIHWPTMFVF